MRIKKFKVKESDRGLQAWASVYSDDEEYLGTWHMTSTRFIQSILDEGWEDLKLKFLGE